MSHTNTDIYVALFAGGSGRRLWPISRKAYPKQFVPLIDDQSTLQLSYQRVRSIYKPENIFLTTHKNYKHLIPQQLPGFYMNNIIYEPERRDVAAAVALCVFSMYYKYGLRGPILLQWTDNHIENEHAFHDLLKHALSMIQDNKQQFIFLGQSPRYPNDNLGWIHISPALDKYEHITRHEYMSSEYRPQYNDCVRYIQNGRTVWNTGYFVTSIEFMVSKFREFSPDITSQIEFIVSAPSPQLFQERLEMLYPNIVELNFDYAFTNNLNKQECQVLSTDFGWSDPGTLSSLKELYSHNLDDVIGIGNVVNRKGENLFIYNTANDKTIVVDGASDIIIINTDDVLLIIPHDKVRHMAELIDYLHTNGYEDIL